MLALYFSLMTERVTKSDCIFCRIVSGEVRADVVFDGGDTLFFRDRSPRARVHLLGIPKSHLESLAQVSDSDEVLLGKIQRDIAKVAQSAGIAEAGYRVITNVGANAGQEIAHLHWHILGGEPVGPLRC